MWQIRHGAGVGLREIIKYQGSQAGKVKGLSKEANDKLHRTWLEDMTIHFLCVLALDKFGDYGSDQTIAPVRETVAQALGAIFRYADAALCLKVANEGLLKLLTASEKISSDVSRSVDSDRSWQMRHGALVGLKYCLSARKDLLRDFICNEKDGQNAIYKAMVDGLRDSVDDVRSVSSSAMLPIYDELIVIVPPHVVYSTIVVSLWKCLVELDDLTSATAFVMNLLSKLIMTKEIAEIVKQREDYSIKQHVSVLYVFLRHTILSVRVAALNTISTLATLSIEDNSMVGRDSWITCELLAMIYQNFLMDDTEEVTYKSLNVWKRLILCIKDSAQGTESLIDEVMTGYFPSWTTLVSTPIGKPLDINLIHLPKRKVKCPNTPGVSAVMNAQETFVAPHDDIMIKQDLTVISEAHLILTRMVASAALGTFLALASNYWREEYDNIVVKLFKERLESPLVTERQFICIIIEEWASAWIKYNKDETSRNFVGEFLIRSKLYDILFSGPESMSSGSPFFCAELHKTLTMLRADCEHLLSDLRKRFSISIPRLPKVYQFTRPRSDVPNFTVDYAIHVATETVPKIINDIKNRYTDNIIPDDVDMYIRQADASSRLIKTSSDSYIDLSDKYEVRWASLCAAALVTGCSLPSKIGYVVKALVSGVKKEQNENIQDKICGSMAIVIEKCVNTGKPEQLVSKMIKNLLNFICNDTPIALNDNIMKIREGILSIDSLDSSAPERDPTNDLLKTLDPEKHIKLGSSKRKKSVLYEQRSMERQSESEDSTSYGEVPTAPRIASRGAIIALRHVCDVFKGSLFEKIGSLWTSLSRYFTDSNDRIYSLDEMLDILNAKVADVEYTEGLVKTLHAVSVIVGLLDPSLTSRVMEFLLPVAACVKSPLAICRYMSSVCMATMCKVSASDVMQVVMSGILPLLNNAGNEIYREGASECIYCIVNHMDHKLLPYIIFFVIPMLRRMSDPIECIRFICSNVFAHLIELIPLESGSSDTGGLNQETISQKEEERKFLGQLIGLEKIEPIDLGVKIEAQLRSYQIEGVNWLAFLHRYNLHGILCDDMGLGKTLQTICIIAASHYGSMMREINDKGEKMCLTSLIVCPSTLTGHWQHEIMKFAPFIKPMIYRGNLAERTALRPMLEDIDIVIMSYDIFRNDVDFFSGINFNYCVLDEGHIIKNPKAKITKATKAIKAAHKVILSGTPIQNNFLDLWSLFDFLMPGFLGTYAQFNEKFRKPLIGPVDTKKAEAINEKRALAMEALHRQVLPFLIRRMKEDVSEDLPPKIIQDYYCERSSLQKLLYDNFNNSRASEQAIDIIISEKRTKDQAKDADDNKKRGIVLQALQYLRKLSNHPALVLDKNHQDYDKAMKLLEEENSNLHDIKHAPKLVALKELLTDCGIGVKTEIRSIDDTEKTPALALHRALIFAQLNSMLDIIEVDLFKKHMPGISYLRLDGKINPKLRHKIVTQFNGDPSIDVLLLTTRVGGLGLTLTGADTVIFVEHDWSPMRDMQAMDRVHRIGQKSIVNVYRLITKDTLEEEIMRYNHSYTVFTSCRLTYSH